MAERQSWWRGSVSPIISSSIAVFVALAIGGAVIAMTGSSVVEAFKALFEGAFGDRRAIGETIVSATPLILGGLAFAIAARAGMFNIGIEGQLVMGAFAAGIIATYDFGPRPLGIAVALIVGMAAGAVWGMLSGLASTLLYIFWFKGWFYIPGTAMAPNTPDHWFLSISPEAFGAVGAAINFIVAILVSRATAAPPEHIQHLVEDIRIPKGAGGATGH